jgi:hypothetical protein
MSLAKAQLEAINSGVIDLNVDNRSYEPATMDNVGSQLNNLAIEYSLMLADELNKKDAASSGQLADSIQPLAVEVNGKVFSVKIQTNAYASFIDEGVDGWANSRGSRFKFKTKGVDPQGKMVKSLKEYLAREGQSARNVKVGISQREIKGKQILDAKTKSAVTAAYMIKRQGIAATHFWRDATIKFKAYLEKELGEAVKIDIINNIVK